MSVPAATREGSSLQNATGKSRRSSPCTRQVVVLSQCSSNPTACILTYSLGKCRGLWRLGEIEQESAVSGRVLHLLPSAVPSMHAAQDGRGKDCAVVAKHYDTATDQNNVNLAQREANCTCVRAATSAACFSPVVGS